MTTQAQLETAGRKSPAEGAAQQIRAILADWAEAHRLKDPARISAHLAHDHVQFILAPPLQYSGANAWDERALRNWFAGFEGPVGFEVSDLQIHAGDRTAFCHFLCRMSANAIGQGEFALWHRATFGFEQRAGRWCVVHVHTSVPFYMDGSFRAALDLAP